MPDENKPRPDYPTLTTVHIATPQITSGGDFVYRLRQPDTALGRIPGVATASITNIFSRRRALCLNADILVIQLLGDPDMLPIMLARRAAGRPTIFEISDNFMNFQLSNPAAAYHDVPENRACILQLIAEADAVQTTVPQLKELYSKYNPHIEVFENQIETPGSTEKPDGPVVVGWGGSVGHFEDIRAAAPEIVRWLNSRADVVFSLMADPKFKSFFSNAPKDRFRFTPPGSLQDYYSFVGGLHIGIAPLRDDPFNLCRSDVKFIEYASHGVVPVCSDVPTYNRTLRDGATGFLFSNTEQMIGILDRLATDITLRKKIASQAHEYIKNERSEQAAAEQRLVFYKSLLPHNYAPGSLDEKKLESMPGLKRFGDSAHFIHELTFAEQHIYNALVYLYNQGNPEEAEISARAAVSAEPDHFYVNYVLGESLLKTNPHAAEKCFRKAAGLFPESCASRLAAARLSAAAGKYPEARAVLQKIQKDCPAFAQAFALEAEISIAENDAAGAEALLRRALEANRFYSPASLRLGAMKLESGDAEEAETFFRDAAETLPRSADARCGMAIALDTLGRENEAAELLLEALPLAADPAPVAGSILKIALDRYKSAKFEDALSLLDRLLDGAPDLLEAIFWAARIAERSGGKKAALPYLKRLAAADTAGKYKRSYQDM